MSTAENVLKRVGAKKSLGEPDLSRLADLMLDESTEVDMKKIEAAVAGKKIVFQDPEPLNEKEKNTVYEHQDGFIALNNKEGRRLSDMTYEILPVLGEPTFYVHQIITQESKRETGYGTDLMEHAEKLAKKKGITTMMLQVDEHNENAQRFFARNGFVQTGAENTAMTQRIFMAKNI